MATTRIAGLLVLIFAFTPLAVPGLRNGPHHTEHQLAEDGQLFANVESVKTTIRRNLGAWHG